MRAYEIGGVVQDPIGYVYSNPAISCTTRR
jgi:hypothetical protein